MATESSSVDQKQWMRQTLKPACILPACIMTAHRTESLCMQSAGDNQRRRSRTPPWRPRCHLAPGGSEPTQAPGTAPRSPTGPTLGTPPSWLPKEATSGCRTSASPTPCGPRWQVRGQERQGHVLHAKAVIHAGGGGVDCAVTNAPRSPSFLVAPKGAPFASVKRDCCWVRSAARCGL